MKTIDSKENNSFPIRGEIYYADLEPVKGSEQGGSRPVLVVSNNLMNETATIVMAVPMTRSEEKVKAGPFNVPYQIEKVQIDDESINQLRSKGYYYAPVNGVILCNQARAVSKDRLIGKVGLLTDKIVIKQVEAALIHSFALMACDDCAIPLRPNGLRCIKCGKVYRTKCTKCRMIFDINYNYCPYCGEGVRK